MGRLKRYAWGALAVGMLGVATGCGTPGAPQPPSLNLPERVTDLAALRTGNQVSLTWTMPLRNTDKLLLKDVVSGSVCRREGDGPCLAAGELTLSAGAKGGFTETLPTGLASGPARVLSYSVELKNRRGRSAGLSNAASILAGTAPDPILGLAAEAHKEGIVLRWESAHAAEAQNGSEGPAVRLHRKLINPVSEAKSKPQLDLLAAPLEPVERNLLVETGTREEAGRALDKNIHFGQTYEYSAQRVTRVRVGGQTLELAGVPSAPIRVEARDVFAPAVPVGLAAIATVPEGGSNPNAGESAGAGPSIDLSWQPDRDANLAGYVVYRREGEEAWKRISPPQPLVVPSFHDAHVLPGHEYRYAVTAVSEGNYESARSIETEETVPAQE